METLQTTCAADVGAYVRRPLCLSHPELRTCAHPTQRRPALRPASRAQQAKETRCSASANETVNAAAALNAPPATAELLALKEWAVTCAALAAGQQTVVLRKGGIDESGFTPRARRFLLFPTSFHSGADLVKPLAAERFADDLAAEPKQQERLAVAVVAEVAGAWSTADPEVLAALDNFHVWTPEYLIKRLRWRRQQPITVLELRCRCLAPPLTAANSPDLWGCFSWVTLPAGDGSSGGRATMDTLWERGTVSLTDSDFVRQQQALRRQLETLQGVEQLHLQVAYT